jgi:hypothetical protein
MRSAIHFRLATVLMVMPAVAGGGSRKIENGQSFLIVPRGTLSSSRAGKSDPGAPGPHSKVFSAECKAASSHGTPKMEGRR